MKNKSIGEVESTAIVGTNLEGIINKLKKDLEKEKYNKTKNIILHEDIVKLVQDVIEMFPNFNEIKKYLKETKSPTLNINNNSILDAYLEGFIECIKLLTTRLDSLKELIEQLLEELKKFNCQ